MAAHLRASSGAASHALLLHTGVHAKACQTSTIQCGKQRLRRQRCKTDTDSEQVMAPGRSAACRPSRRRHRSRRQKCRRIGARSCSARKLSQHQRHVTSRPWRLASDTNDDMTALLGLAALQTGCRADVLRLRTGRRACRVTWARWTAAAAAVPVALLEQQCRSDLMHDGVDPKLGSTYRCKGSILKLLLTLERSV